MVLDTMKRPMRVGAAPDVSKLAAQGSAGLDGGNDALAFATVRELAGLLKGRKVTSVGLTKMYLARLKKYDPILHFVITLTEERAMKQAAVADLLLFTQTSSDPATRRAIPDDRLLLMFACAHPAIDPLVRAPLMLQTILGLDAAANVR